MVPDQAPEPEQESAGPPTWFQTRAAPCPFSIVLGFAVNVKFGAAGGGCSGVVTVTVTDLVVVPALLVQAIAYAVVTLGETDRDPERPAVPLNPLVQAHDVG